MTDVFDKRTRARIMRAVRTAETEPEELLAVALRAAGLRFLRNDKAVFGVPDFVFRKAKLAVFVDGDFWHGRAWFKSGAAPATNSAFWISKFERNRRRDRLVTRELKRTGWTVLRLWSSDVRKNSVLGAVRVHKRLQRAPTRTKGLTSKKPSRQRLRSAAR